MAKLSWLEHTVNSDCSGKIEAITPNRPVPLNIFLSLVEHGKQLYSVVNWHALIGVWTRVN